jgi:hypothetical protein
MGKSAHFKMVARLYLAAAKMITQPAPMPRKQIAPFLDPL